MVDNNYKGLSSKEAKKKLDVYGLNQVEENKISILKIFLHQFSSPLVFLLILASTISFFSGGISDGIIILIMIIMNTVLGFTQEYRSNKTFEKLKQYISNENTVIRNGKIIKIDKKFIVPGDILIFKIGDIVSADCYILEKENLLVDESSITGESISIYKDINNKRNVNKSIGNLYSGSSIVKGECIAEVFATGKSSKFGKIADLSLNTKKHSEFNENVNTLSRWFTMISAVSLTIILASHLMFSKDNNFAELFLFTLAIAITIIPEALPVITTLALAKGAKKLSRKKVIIRKNSSVEDLGNVDIICTDKTGTLTKNSIIIKDFVTQDEKNFFKYSYLLTADSEDNYDIALYQYLKKNKVKKENVDDFKDIPFDPVNRYSGREFDDYTIIKGASEYIIELCKNSGPDEELRSKIKDYEKEGYRDFSIAMLKGKNYEYFGTFIFEDEIKEETYDVIQRGLKQNIGFKIITGDSLSVATNVGRRVGLLNDDKDAIEAHHLDFEDDEILRIQVEKYHIFARTDPEQKYKIIKALQQKFHVGYMGDGINDAPSLALANVSIVVDTASEIAKSNADIILLNKDLGLIVDGIIEGRKIFINIDKYIRHTLSANFGNLYTIGVISIFLNFLPLLPVQILMNNLLGDFPSLAVPNDNVEVSETRKPKHHKINIVIFYSIIMGGVAALSNVIFFLLIKDFSENYIQSMLFVFATLSELLAMFLMRTRMFVFKGSKPSFGLSILSLISVGIVIYAIFFGISFIKVIKIEIPELIILLSVIGFYLIISEIVKLIFYKFVKDN